MMEASGIREGWTFAAELAGADLGAQGGAAYIDDIESAIQALEDAVNYHEHRNNTIATFQGFLAEDWSAGTFNIDAVAKGSSDRATVLKSTDGFSVDVRLNSGADYSMKSYANGAKSAVEQSRYNADTGKGGYDGQLKWVPEDQLTDAQAKAHHEYLRNTKTRPEVADAYGETERTLRDIVENDENVTSRTATRKDLDNMAKAGKKQEFKAKDFGVTTENSINYDYIRQKAIEAGCTAAVITIAMQLAPEIYKSVDYLIKNGELDFNQIQKSGEKAISGGAEGFLRGSIAYYLQSVCNAGALGDALMNISPMALGAAVAISMQTVKNSILVAAGKMDAKQMGAAFADNIVITGGYLAGAKVGGAIGTALGFEMPVLGYMLGSLIGTSCAVLYNIGKKRLISLCVDTGFTCFGLVEQDYELPDEVLESMGIDMITIPEKEIKQTQIKTISVHQFVDVNEPETIDLTMVKRGIIGVNKVGYVLA